ncbi:hypothetical protein AIOL_001554 [Candidatus Rhodobacter oscarellae]|uniref:Uncharacterized protein n=1 Tax=Candidatus Rhodobacter oscarellae TaxID=1675527 RepID=A0A0J9E1I6_9RHOB|nr:hypothetical protein [Candidatus Rhodobacter lobularis]KMW56600.1 hypothetical protein AIOL_001554 [Candidatus Rhodobacter lobularis]
MELDRIDKTQLIKESYRIEGISAEECRTIFVDWALKLPADIVPQEAIAVLYEAYAAAAPDHPMSQVLKDGMVAPTAPKRRGGRRGRVN